MQRLLFFHLRHAETAAAGVGLHEARQPETRNHAVLVGQVLALTHEHGVGDVQVGIGAEEVVERKFVECQSLNEHVARGIGQADEVEVALQDAVLARRAVNGDIGKVELPAAVGRVEREVGAADGIGGAVGIVGVPVALFNFYDVAVVFFLIHKGENAFGASH